MVLYEDSVTKNTSCYKTNGTYCIIMAWAFLIFTLYFSLGVLARLGAMLMHHHHFLPIVIISLSVIGLGTRTNRGIA